MVAWDKIVLVSAIGLGVYVVGQFIVFRQIEAVDYWEVRGYINGLIRGSGDRDTAISNLTYWRDWWKGKAWWNWPVDHFFDYGMSRIDELYP